MLTWENCYHISDSLIYRDGSDNDDDLNQSPPLLYRETVV